jgi:hypothetical protein
MLVYNPFIINKTKWLSQKHCASGHKKSELSIFFLWITKYQIWFFSFYCVMFCPPWHWRRKWLSTNQLSSFLPLDIIKLIECYTFRNFIYIKCKDSKVISAFNSVGIIYKYFLPVPHLVILPLNSYSQNKLLQFSQGPIYQITLVWTMLLEWNQICFSIFVRPKDFVFLFFKVI